MSPQKPVFPLISEDTKLETLVGERSVIIFQRFKFTVDDIPFHQYSSTGWSDFESFRKLKRLVSTLHVTNDLAERSIKILQDYKEILTEDLKHREITLHCVEKNRQERPDFRKSTSAYSLSACKLLGCHPVLLLLILAKQWFYMRIFEFCLIGLHTDMFKCFYILTSA